MAKKQSEASERELLSQLVREVSELKTMFAAMLLQKGASQADIAQLLNVSQPTVSRMFPKGLPKHLRRD